MFCNHTIVGPGYQRSVRFALNARVNAYTKTCFHWVENSIYIMFTASCSTEAIGHSPQLRYTAILAYASPTAYPHPPCTTLPILRTTFISPFVQ